MKWFGTPTIEEMIPGLSSPNVVTEAWTSGGSMRMLRGFPPGAGDNLAVRRTGEEPGRGEVVFAGPCTRRVHVGDIVGVRAPGKWKEALIEGESLLIVPEPKAKVLRTAS